jgi:enoyl-CoA hydratase/carnithine racemase
VYVPLTPDLLIGKREAFLWLTINRHERRNSLTQAVVDAMVEVLQQASKDLDLRGVVITGAGERAFCAGADIREFVGGANEQSVSHISIRDLLLSARQMPIPLIARVNGACLGLGMALVGMCHLAVARTDAVFGLPEVKLGMFPAQVLTALRNVVSHRALVRLSVTGERISAAQALGLGLVDYVDDDVDGRVGRLLRNFLENSPAASRCGLGMIRAIESMSYEESLAFTATEVSKLAATEDAIEGRAAVYERRKPRWTQ